ncbi:MAG: hypothetical protein J6K96_02770 [Treponema sp.]|nr:hypothetical protein [Treponema sp.]
MLDFSIYTINGDHKFSINEENDFTIIVYSNLISIFSEIDYEKHIINFCCQQKMDNCIREKINSWGLAYESANIQIRKIKKYFDEISDGEFFFVFPTSNFSLLDVISIFENLRALNEGKSQEEIDKQIANVKKEYYALFADVFNNYNIQICDIKKKYTYGEPVKEKRCCRYCKKTMADGVTFKNIAHAISEGLGNKTIISAEECDNCNSKFAETIEKDIIEYLKLYRTLYGKKGKNGVPHLKYKNGIELKHDGKKANFLDIAGNCHFSEGNFSIPLKFSSPINFMNIYRALVKFVIGVIPVEYIQYYSRTIEWLNNIKNDGSKINLPPVTTLLNNQTFYDQPELCIYMQKKENKELPFIYAEFKSTFFIFVYIIPFSDKDIIDFSIKENFDKFWQFNKHYSTKEGWVFNNFNLDKDIVVTMNLNFSKATD